MQACRHQRREAGQCPDCGECDHDVILNGACYYCGETEIEPPSPADTVPVERLVRKPADSGD